MLHRLYCGKNGISKSSLLRQTTWTSSSFICAITTVYCVVQLNTFKHCSNCLCLLSVQLEPDIQLPHHLNIIEMSL